MSTIATVSKDNLDYLSDLLDKAEAKLDGATTPEETYYFLGVSDGFEKTISTFEPYETNKKQDLELGKTVFVVVAVSLLAGASVSIYNSRKRVNRRIRKAFKREN